MRPSALYWLPFFLLVAACSTTPAAPVIKTEVVKVAPPASLLAPCQTPLIVPSTTVKDLARNSLARQSAFDRCAIQVECIAAWYEDEPASARKCGAFFTR
ncbi:o-spanin [Stenotrophomonas phage Silvanus]|nr:o-spanin [Stenotrophomonas phage Silvanus]